MENIEKNTIEELKEKLAGYLFNKQNHSRGIGNDEFYVQAYLNQIWQNLDLDHKQKQCIKTAYREMIIDGHLNMETEVSAEPEEEVMSSSDSDSYWNRESESRISLTDEGIVYYIYTNE